MTTAKTKPKVAKSDTRPDKDINVIVQTGIKAQNLAAKYATTLGARLSATFLATYAGDLAALPGTVPDAMTKRDGAVQLTAAQATALLNGYNLVKGIKHTVRSQGPEKDVLLAYGVGVRMSKLLVKDVTNGINKILARVKANTTEAASFDIGTADTDALNAALAAIQAADLAQEAGRAAVPQSTKTRNATARRVLAGIRKIAGAGMRAFPEDPTVFAQFEALITSSKAQGG
jgi:hypothetical protein